MWRVVVSTSAAQHVISRVVAIEKVSKYLCAKWKAGFEDGEASTCVSRQAAAEEVKVRVEDESVLYLGGEGKWRNGGRYRHVRRQGGRQCFTGLKVMCLITRLSCISLVLVLGVESCFPFRCLHHIHSPNDPSPCVCTGM